MVKGLFYALKSKCKKKHEKPSNYLCSLERSNYASKLITKLHVGGRYINNPEHIFEEQMPYYADLRKYLCKYNANWKAVLVCN